MVDTSEDTIEPSTPENHDSVESAASENHDHADDATIEPSEETDPELRRNESSVESLVPQAPPMPRSIGPKPFVSMLLLLSAAALASGGQHLFYSYVDGKNVETFRLSQDWVIRVGTGFAFLFHTLLVPAVATAYAQRFWYSAGQRPLTVRTIDGLFALAGNPLELFNLEILCNTKMLSVFALVGYFIPLASILSPGALTVVNTLTTANITAYVPTVSVWDGDVGFIEFGSGNSYLGPSNQLSRIATRVLTIGEVLTFPSPCGANCTYHLTLAGPAYRCLEYDPSLPLPNLTGPAGYPFDEYNPDTFPYYSVEIVGNNTGDGLWVLYGPNATIHCTLWNATYRSNISFTNNIAEISTTVELGSQLNSTNITLPASTYALYSNPQTSLGVLSEWEALNTYTIQKAVSSLLQGYIYVAGVYGGLNTQDTMIGVANFVDVSPFNVTFHGNVSNLIESLLINTTLSITNFLSRPALPDNSGRNVSQPATYTQVPAFITAFPQEYAYNHLPLWGSYGLALGFATICCIVGGLMVWRNGMAGDLGFSQVMKTTRNPTLDKLCRGTVLANGLLATGELKQARLRYGVLPGNEPRMAFGTEDEIIPIKTRK